MRAAKHACFSSRARKQTMYLFKTSTAIKPLPQALPLYRRLLNWSTNLFGSIRVFTYVPTIMTLVASADSSQYNLLTWAAWVMANASMTASIYESNGRKLTNLVLVNAGNTMMCLVTMAVIWYYRH